MLHLAVEQAIIVMVVSSPSLVTNPLSWFPSSLEITRWASGESSPEPERVREILNGAHDLGKRISQDPGAEIEGLHKEVWAPRMMRSAVEKTQLITLREPNSNRAVRIHLPIETDTAYRITIYYGRVEQMELKEDGSPRLVKIHERSITPETLPFDTLLSPEKRANSNGWVSREITL